MKKIQITVAVSVLLLVPLGSAMALQNVPGPNTQSGWPFGDGPREIAIEAQDDFVITIGADALVPGSLVSADLGVSFRVNPFFTDSQTDFVVLPTFAMTQSLETGISFDWWTASVAVDLSLSPWSLTSTGGWLELHPPLWVISTTPWLTLDGTLGWGPQWMPVADWFHRLGGSLDIRADWTLATLWESTLDLTVASYLDAEWTFPNGAFLTNWMVQLDARSILPLFVDSRAALRAGARAQVFVFPTFGFGFDVRLEFRADPFTAYGLIGAGDAGIRAEAGIEWSIGWLLFNGLD
ncbi:hypothetical protein KKG90_12280 [Candidatus Bipolaricaulota bacterium]|nr:hypothetical protein [Candidatus Bipolaricaulota bacterium]